MKSTRIYCPKCNQTLAELVEGFTGEITIHKCPLCEESLQSEWVDIRTASKQKKCICKKIKESCGEEYSWVTPEFCSECRPELFDKPEKNECQCKENRKTFFSSQEPGAVMCKVCCPDLFDKKEL